MQRHICEVVVLLRKDIIVYMIVLTSVSDFTELSIANNYSIEHNMHADLPLYCHCLGYCMVYSIVNQISA